MAPSAFVAGATGNTGQNVIRMLPDLLKSAGEDYRILALTRNMQSEAANEFAKIPQVEGLYRSTQPTPPPSKYTGESTLLVAMLQAGFKPVSTVYYGRTHWTIEEALSHPDFAALQWTSLRAIILASFTLGATTQWVKGYRRTGEQTALKLTLGKYDKVAAVDSDDVGRVVATLLALSDPAPHNKKRYIIRGAEDTTGQDIVDMVEQATGAQIEDVEWRDTSIIDELPKQGYPEIFVVSIRTSLDPIWPGKCTVDGVPTSKEIIDLAPPTTTAAESFKALIALDAPGGV
ncbi:hypothetical protein EJ02DRAFT_504195 [Clathrospora elynae]|uniref:NAD(P)-binding protein n=1 Tax=Clathrospora elynae TaxID=706981 RepID=A0A6A5SIB5_9PLEO|nr:hypothetical protein EJ02DRAFT_504195 [Clathrospora elynae]